MVSLLPFGWFNNFFVPIMWRTILKIFVPKCGVSGAPYLPLALLHTPCRSLWVCALAQRWRTLPTHMHAALILLPELQNCKNPSAHFLFMSLRSFLSLSLNGRSHWDFGNAYI